MGNELFDDPTEGDVVEPEAQPLLEQVGLVGEDVKILIMVQELAILDAYAKQLEEQTKFVKKLGTLMTSALIEHDDFIDVSNTKLRISQELTTEVLSKVNHFMKDTSMLGDFSISYPVTAYRKESWFANIPADNLEDAIRGIESSHDRDWEGLVKESINANSLRGKVNEIIKRLASENKNLLLTPEIVKENLPAFVRDYVNVARVFDVVTMKATGK